VSDVKRYLVIAAIGALLALVPRPSAGASIDDALRFAKCADAAHPLVEITTRVKGWGIRPIAGGDFVVTRAGMTIKQSDGTPVATVETAPKSVTVRGGWASYAGNEVDRVQIFATKDASCAPDDRAITLRFPVIPPD
jgi:hypothetical protein